MRTGPALTVSIAPLLALLLPGCAEQGTFPSLLPRPIEQADAAPDAVPAPPPPAPADPALASRLHELVARARQGQQAFEEQLGRTQRLVNRAGAAQSESWVEAQQALSRLESARGPTTTALGDVDVLAASRRRSAEAGPADLAAIAAALEAIEALAIGQSEEISRLNGRLPPG